MDIHRDVVSYSDLTWLSHMDSWWTNVYFYYIPTNFHISALDATATIYIE